MPPRPLRFVLWIAGALLLGLILWRACGQPEPIPKDGMSEPTRQLEDSLRATDTTTQRKLREAEAAASAARERSRSAERAASLAKDSAAKYRELAETSQNARDSADHFKLALDFSEARADSLQRALEQERQATKAIFGAVGELKDRIAANERSRENLRRDLAEMARRLEREQKRTKVAFTVGGGLGFALGRWSKKG